MRKTKPFEVGEKGLQTRDGREVRIYATNGGGPSPIHGAVAAGSGRWTIYCWYTNGNFYPHKEDDLDIVREPTFYRLVEVGEKFMECDEVLSPDFRPEWHALRLSDVGSRRREDQKVTRRLCTKDDLKFTFD